MMAVTCDAILELAEYDLNSAKCEARYRNIVGRAYYACFHRAKEFHLALPDQGLLPAERVGVHRELTYSLENPTVTDDSLKKKSKRIGYICRDLHAKRVDADYKVEMEIGRNTAEIAVKQAKMIFEITQ